MKAPELDEHWSMVCEKLRREWVFDTCLRVWGEEPNEEHLRNIGKEAFRAGFALGLDAIRDQEALNAFLTDRIVK